MCASLLLAFDVPRNAAPLNFGIVDVSAEHDPLLAAHLHGREAPQYGLAVEHVFRGNACGIVMRLAPIAVPAAARFRQEALDSIRLRSFIEVASAPQWGLDGDNRDIALVPTLHPIGIDVRMLRGVAWRRSASRAWRFVRSWFDRSLSVRISVRAACGECYARGDCYASHQDSHPHTVDRAGVDVQG
jgi:hypothetical protein